MWVVQGHLILWVMPYNIETTVRPIGGRNVDFFRSVCVGEGEGEGGGRSREGTGNRKCGKPEQ